MKEYMLFIRKKGDSQHTLPPGEFVKFLKSCELYIDSLKNQGKLISAQPIAWAGKIISRDGFTWNEVPYSETGEVIGGYYHILTENINEAIEIAKANPEFTFNENTRIEVRPVKIEEEQTGFVYPSETT
jgi:hypothetical protein